MCRNSIQMSWTLVPVPILSDEKEETNRGTSNPSRGSCRSTTGLSRWKNRARSDDEMTKGSGRSNARIPSQETTTQIALVSDAGPNLIMNFLGCLTILEEAAVRKRRIELFFGACHASNY